MAAFIKETRIYITSTNEIIIKQRINISTHPKKRDDVYSNKHV